MRYTVDGVVLNDRQIAFLRRVAEPSCGGRLSDFRDLVEGTPPMMASRSIENTLRSLAHKRLVEYDLFTRNPIYGMTARGREILEVLAR